ncbi:MAG: bacterial transcriptional activator domain-containing protein [Alphaproteobacteria bacterium]|nr:bacterial transcriptional activator domain-containing protein [Alphaproteobacteria bacterium]
MYHPITSETRLAGTAGRLYRRFFQPDDPHGWADYHCVGQPDGRFWIHTHGLRRWRLPELEFIDVPHDMRGHAHQLMFAIVDSLKSAGVARSDGDVDGISSAPSQNFRQMATLCPVPHDDPRHRDITRVVDWNRPVESGFPLRLFAAHLAAWAELADDPVRKEAMCRRALAIFPGYFLEMTAGADVNPGNADLTDLQHRANLSAYLSLADALFAQGRAGEAIGYLEEAIARCPGWGQVHRGYLVGKYRRKDVFMNFWRGADIVEICARRRPPNTTGVLPKPRRIASKARKSHGTKGAA